MFGCRHTGIICSQKVMKDRVDFNEKAVMNGELFIVCEVETEAFVNADTGHTLHTEIYLIKC